MGVFAGQLNAVENSLICAKALFVLQIYVNFALFFTTIKLLSKMACFDFFSKWTDEQSNKIADFLFYFT